MTSQINIEGLDMEVEIHPTTTGGWKGHLIEIPGISAEATSIDDLLKWLETGMQLYLNFKIDTEL